MRVSKEDVNKLLPVYKKYMLSRNNYKLSHKDIGIFNNFKEDKKFLDSFIKLYEFNSIKYREYLEAEEEIGVKKVEQLNKIGILDPIKYINSSNVYRKRYNEKFFTNAFRKMYEICEKTEFIPVKEEIRHFDICGFPGAFIFAINHYIKTKLGSDFNYDWYMQSYRDKNSNNRYFKDEFGLVKKYNNRFITGSYKGDITDYRTTLEYYNKLKENKFDIVTSDCGLGSTYGEERETKLIKIFFGQFICGISVLKEGGNFFMKSYHFKSNFNVSLLYLMTLLFENVYFIKPESSRFIGGEEIYILLMNYKKINCSERNKIVYKLIGVLKSSKTINPELSLISYRKINKQVLNNIYSKFSLFYKNKLQLKILRQTFMNKYIKSDMIDFDKYKKEQLELKRKTDIYIKKYADKYFKRMNYEKIKNIDKL